MRDEFTVKEIVKQIYDKQEKMDDKIDNIHAQTTATNGTVKLHTKLIWGSYGFTLALLLIGINIIV